MLDYSIPKVRSENLSNSRASNNKTKTRRWSISSIFGLDGQTQYIPLHCNAVIRALGARILAITAIVKSLNPTFLDFII